MIHDSSRYIKIHNSDARAKVWLSQTWLDIENQFAYQHNTWASACNEMLELCGRIYSHPRHRYTMITARIRDEHNGNFSILRLKPRKSLS